MVSPAAKIALLVLALLTFTALVAFFFKTQISLFVSTLLKHRETTKTTRRDASEAGA